MDFNLDKDANYLNNAYHLAIMSHLAYSVYLPEERKVLESTFNVVEFPHKNIEGYIAINDKNLVIVFRGTDELADILNDLNLSKVEFSGIEAHQGFVDALNEVWLYIEKAAAAHKQTIWLTGHSFGGALAILAFKKLYDKGYNPIAAYSFGSPRSVSKKSTEELAGLNIHNFINDQDAVPCLPPMMGYGHAGKQSLITSDGEIVPHIPFTVSLRWYLIELRFLIKSAILGMPVVIDQVTETFQDHKIENYAAKIKTALQEI
jgi:hypothetical protein